METDGGQEQDAGSSSQASGADSSDITRGAWMGSSVSEYEIDWLYRSRRIPEGVTCRLPGDKIEPVPNPGTFFYVKNNGAADLIDLPPFDPAPPTKTNWSYNPKESHNETNRIIRFMKQQMKDTDICSDDIIRTFISRRVLPLQRHAHKMCEMYGPGDPTKITGLPLSKKDVVLKARQICQTAMPEDWGWGLRPLSSTNPPTQEAKDRFPGIESDRRGRCRKRGLDKFDPDPVIHWRDLKMGRTAASRLGKSPPEPAGSSDELTILEAEAGQEFVDKLMAQGKKNKTPASDAGAKLLQPNASGPNLSRPRAQAWLQAEGSAGSARTSTPPPHSSPDRVPAPPLPPLREAQQVRGARPLHRRITAEGGPPLLRPKTPAPATWAPGKNLPGGRNLRFLPSLKRRKRRRPPPRPRRKLPCRQPLRQRRRRNLFLRPRATPTPKPTQGPPATRPSRRLRPSRSRLPQARASRGKAADGSASSGSQPLVLHVGPAAVVVQEKPSGLLGRIVELKREGKDLGHLLPYAQKWNDADISAATRGLGKDRLPAPDPAGPRSTEEHFTRLSSTADARKALFEELLWEHRDLAEAHSQCQAIPEASIEALKAQVAALQAEKEQLIRDHQKALEAQKKISRELKDQAIQAGVRHAEELKAAESAAEARLNEALEDAGNANVVLQAGLEEATKALKTAEGKAAKGHKAAAEEATRASSRGRGRAVEGGTEGVRPSGYADDALALRLFPDSQAHAIKKVAEHRADGV
ncbi:hypothetical protein QYE76_021590 [Lolium multiflorum]|uniref:Uncharacterized protein n=1 Tax=Lolium multiflorum TaxID=4521 RepID=A0AAD8R6U0_LOLMU|nr:hypothetical protein QYE76_021590 [Lolium multiflorum]